jgi:hypothetical protein
MDRTNPFRHYEPVVGYEEDDTKRETPIDTFIHDVEGVYMPGAEVGLLHPKQESYL